LQRSTYNKIRGTLALLGVALGLILTATSASAAEGDTGASNDEAVIAASEPSDAPAIGDALFIDRPAPARDPASELPADPGPLDVAVPAAAPTPAAPAATHVATPAVVPAATATHVTTTRVTPAVRASTPRQTQVLGVQILRSDTQPPEAAVALARTGVDTFDLALVALGLLALGSVLVKVGEPRQATR